MMMFRPLLVAATSAAFLFVPAAAQAEALPPQPGVLVGQMQVTGATWSFSANVPHLSGPWGSATLTNTNCSRPFLPGTAQAGAVIFTAAVVPGVGETGNLHAFRGSNASGSITVAPLTDSGSGTRVTASLSGLEPFVQSTTLAVCLTASPLPVMLAAIDVGQQRVAASNFDVTGVSTASTPDFQPLIAISGSQTTPDGANSQWVFFFDGTAFLGTDTLNPSLAPLQLVGSPGPNQLDVSYEDPDGGPPVTVTYTFADGALTASGTPPGH